MLKLFKYSISDYDLINEKGWTCGVRCEFSEKVLEFSEKRREFSEYVSEFSKNSRES